MDDREMRTNWIDRRAALEAAIPEAWNLLCIEFGQTLESFNRTYGQERHVTTALRRVGNCVHVTCTPTGTAIPTRAIDICVDAKECRIFSRIEGEEENALVFVAGPAIRDKDGVQLTNDQVSEFFLREFFFPTEG